MSSTSLSYFVNGIKNQSDEVAIKVAQQLHHFAGTELKEMPFEESNNFLEQFNQRIFDLVSSPDYYDKRAGILAIMSLIGIDNGTNSSRLSRCANYLRNMLPSSNQNLMELAAKAIGHLALSSETYTTEYVDFETRRAFEWLNGERNEERRHAAVLVLKELAICTPTIFMQHLQQYFETIFIALKDTKPAIRECASLSLRAVLNIVSQRESRDIHKPAWYQLSINQAFTFLQEAASKERSYAKEDKTHAGLLTINELIRIGCIHSEEVKKEFEGTVVSEKYKGNIFYKSPAKSKIKLDLSINFLQFQNQMFLDFIYSLMPSLNPSNKLQELTQSETCRMVLIQNFDIINNHVYKALTSRNMHVQLILIEIIPRLAFLRPEKMNKSMLQNCLTFLITATRKDLYKSSSYLSIGYLVLALKNDSFKIFPKIIDCIKVSFTAAKEAPLKKKSTIVDSAVFSCLRMLIKTFKESIETQIRDLLESIFSCGLSPALITCLSDICTDIKALKPTVQENLLNYLSAIIMNKPYSYYPNSFTRSSSTYSVSSSYQMSDGSSLGPIEVERLALAIRTLREFDFCDYPLLELVKCVADHHLTMDSKNIRIEAIKTCLKLLYTSTLPAKFNPLSFDKGRTEIMTDILDRIIPIGVNDKKASVRLVVFESVEECYDPFLVQPKHLAVCYMAVHDENFEVRENVMCLLGRLTTIDPSSILPVLRKFLLQLLTDINDSGIGRNKEHSARLISLMVAHMPRLVQLYVPTILKVLTPLLKDPGPNPGVTINALAAIGELALVCGLETRRWNHETVAIVVDMLRDGNLSSIREVALWTLGQLVESAGYVVEPYNDFPFLLDILMTFLRSEPIFRIRYETIRVMGIIGALDPFVHKHNLESYNSSLCEAKRDKTSSSKIAQTDDGGSCWNDIDSLPEDCSVNELWVNVNASLDEFYPCAAITCLMKILKDPTLSQHHTISVQAITFIFKSLGPKAHLYIRRVVPTFLILIRTSDAIREFLFQQLGIIASLVKVYLRNYLGEICGLIKEYWSLNNNLQATVISLLNQLATNMGSDIRPYLPDLMPLMLKVLMYDGSGIKANSQKVLTIIQVLGNYIDSYIHILLPAIIDIITTPDQYPINVRRVGLETVNALLQTTDMSEYASTLIHPLLSLIDAAPSNGTNGSGGSGAALTVQQQAPPLVTFPPPGMTGSYLFHSSVQQSISGGGGSFGEANLNLVGGGSTTGNPELRAGALQALTSVVAQLGRRFLTLFAPLVTSVLLRNNVTYPPYEMIVLKLLEGSESSATYQGSSHDSTFTCYDKLPANIPDPSSKSRMDVVPIKKLNINATTLQKAWVVKGRISKDDWMEWLKKFSIDILKESPSPSLRSCWALAQNYAPLAKDLFNASFVSCWMDLSEHYQDALVDNLQEALLTSDVSEVALTLLNLAEFMDHCEKGPLPLDTILLGQQAVKYRAYAKALRYKEEEFYKGATPEILESLICINNKLKQHEASAGILKYALKNFPEELSTHETWYEKLDEWDAALQVYNVKMKADPANETIKLGAMRCLEALGEWSQVLELGNEWTPTDSGTQQKVASLACSASWGIGDWTSMEKYVNFLPEKIQDGAFYRAVISIKKNECDTAGMYISKCRDLLETELSALASESYERAYNSVVMAQILSEMEEAVQYKLLPDRQPVIKRMWWDRLLGCQKILSNWHKIIQVHSLVITPQEDQIPWLKYVSLCNKNGRFSLSHKTLTMLLGFDPTKQSDRALMLANPHVVFSYLKYVWKSGHKNDAFIKLSSFVSDHLQSKLMEMLKTGDVAQQTELRSLLSKCYLKMGQWSENLNGVTDASIPQILHYYVSAIDCSNNWYKAWHAWACTNFEALLYYKQQGILQNALQPSGGVSLIGNTEGSASATGVGIDSANLKSQITPLASGSNLLGTASSQDIPSRISLGEGAFLKTKITTASTVPTLPKGTAPRLSLTHIRAPTPKLPSNLMGAHRGSSFTGTDRAQQQQLTTPTAAGLLNYVILAVKGFIQSISFSQSSTSLQDTLRLLTLCFDYGQYQDVYEALQDGIKMIRIDNWLQVIPQLIARIDIPRPLVHKLIHQLLIEIGNFHPQALIYPLTVASKSDIPSRQNAAKKILQALCEHNNTLVQQALMVSEELIRVSIVWHELWHEGLEDASRLYFGEKNIRGMLAVLEPLHAMIEKGPQTLKETSFTQAYGRDLAEAKIWCTKYLQSHNIKDLTQAWDLYYHTFRRISKELPQITSLQLQHVSPKLLACHDLELAVPGTYKSCAPSGGSFVAKKYSKNKVSPKSPLMGSNGEGDYREGKKGRIPTEDAYEPRIVRIARVRPALQVISSKQRPRKLKILGDDGIEYLFLLKGHEDLRQDERVMQLFGLVNTLLRTDFETVRRNLVIQRYSVVPLSTNSGLISWVPHCDTLHTLIKDHRESRKILINIEHKIMLRMSPDYDRLTLYQKTEVFEHALEHTKGDDLARVLWLKSPPNSQDWFDRRLNYTRSLALMSVVGYILGLGDRHPSNLMLDRISGKILHIDFGDCFEVAMSREKFPEKVPFRLTRMLINAMEVSGIEGTFRMTCERVMEVLQLNKDSVMSVLEAFVYDPLINWRLMESEDQPESLNLKALAIIKKVKEKLTGRDFNPNETLDVKTQIDLLIKQATSHENLCEMYIGWCPFW